MDRKILLEITVRAGGGFEVTDPRNNRHYAHSEIELADLIRRLAHDPTMPQAEKVRPTETILEEVGTIFATSRLPGSMQGAAPVIGRAFAEVGGAVSDIGRSAIDWIRNRKSGEPVQAEPKVEQTRGPVQPPPPRDSSPRARAARKPDGAPRVKPDASTSSNTTPPRSTRRTSLRFPT